MSQEFTPSSPLAGEPLLLSVPRVAELTGMSRSRTYSLVARGIIPSRRLSKRAIVISRPALEEWLANGGEQDV